MYRSLVTPRRGGSTSKARPLPLQQPGVRAPERMQEHSKTECRAGRLRHGAVRAGETHDALAEAPPPRRCRADADCLDCRRKMLRAIGVTDVEEHDADGGASADGPRCGCSRKGCGHPSGCKGVPQPQIALGNSEDVALCALRGDPAHARAARSIAEVARGPRLRQLPPRHARRRWGAGRRGPGPEPAAASEYGCLLPLLAPCVRPPRRLQRTPAAECRSRELRHGLVRTAGARTRARPGAVRTELDQWQGAALTATASTADAGHCAPPGSRTM